MGIQATIERKIKGVIQRKFFYNPRMQPLVWRMYYTPDKRRPQVPISERAATHGAELREKGVTVVPGFAGVADHIETTYFAAMEGTPSNAHEPFEILDLGDREAATGSVTGRVSFMDPGLAPLLFDSDVCGILYNYYQRQPYYRHQPWVIKNALAADIPPDEFAKLEISSKFHIDCFRQITMMLLVNDVGIEDTHLQYAVGSHKFIHHPWNRFEYSDAEIAERYPIFDAVGPKGSLIIMDAGSGFHRGYHRIGTVRKTLQAVVTTGHYFELDEARLTTRAWLVPAQYPGHVRHMIDRVARD